MNRESKFSKLLRKDSVCLLFLLLVTSLFLIVEFKALFTSTPRLKSYINFDFIHFYFPQINDLMSGFEIKNFSVTLWDQFSSAGTPKIVHSGFYYLPNYLLKIPFKLNNNFLPLSTYELFVLSHYLVAAAGGFFFFRLKRFSLPLAMLGAFIFAFSSVMLITYWPVFIFAIALFPWILFALEKYKSGRQFWLFIASFIAFQQLAVSQQFFVYSMIFISAYLLVQDLRIKTLVTLAYFYLTTLTYSAVFLLPLFNFSREASRINYIDSNYLSMGASAYSYIKDMALFESSVVGLSLYLGPVVIILIVYHLTKSKAKSDWLILALALIFFLFSTYTSLFQSLSKALPVLNQMRTHSRANELVIFALIMLLLRSLSNFRFDYIRYLKVSGLVSVALILLYLIGGNYSTKSTEQLYISLILIGIATIIATARSRNLFSDKVFLILIAMVIIFDLGHVIQDVENQQKNYPLTASGKIDKSFWLWGENKSLALEPSSRFQPETFNEFDYNKFQIYRSYAAGSYSAAGGELTPATLKRYDDFLAAAKQNPNLLRVLNIRVAPDYLPRAFTLSCYRVEADDDKLLAGLSDKRFSGSDFLFLSSKPDGLDNGSSASCKDTLSPVASAQDQDRINFSPINSPKPTLLFISDNWYPGWKAFVNGRERPVLLADYTFKAVALESGESHVEFKFTPRINRIGFWISISAYLLSIGYIIYELIKTKRQELKDL